MIPSTLKLPRRESGSAFVPAKSGTNNAEINSSTIKIFFMYSLHKKFISGQRPD
jgi:hypothetical protein